MRPTQRPPTRPGAPLRRGPALALAFTLAALAAACFNPPNAAVMFACDPAGDAACPDGYTCRVDGCCHRDGSDEPEDGQCKLGGGDFTGGAGTTSTDATSTDATTTDATSTAATSTTDGTDTSSSSSSTGPQTTGT